MTDFRPPSLQVDSNDQAVAQLAIYYSSSQPYVGARFDTWSSRHCSESSTEFTADDLVAVSFLSVNVPPLAAKRLLTDDPSTFNNLLAEIPPHLSFWEAGEPSEKSPQWKLEKELMAISGVGLAIASKLMARKRPYLVPILDSVVRSTLGLPQRKWASLYGLFSDVEFRNRLETVRAEVHQRDDVMLPDDLSLLRTFDVVTWMDGKAMSASDPVYEGWPQDPARDED